MPSTREDFLPLLLAAPVLVLCGWWSLDDGGYEATRWMAGAVVVAVLLAISIVAAGTRMRSPSRAATIALGAFVAYTLWSFASLLWADSQGAALEGSQRSLLYLMCFALFALLPWTPRAVLVALGAFVAVVTGVGLITLLQLAGMQDPSSLLVEARLAAPLGYQNATAALWTMAALPALGLAVRRETAWVLRGPFLAASGLLVGLAILAQSRGWLVSLPILALAALAMHPERWRWLAGAGVVAASALATSGALLEPYAVGGGARPGTLPELRAAFDAAAVQLWLAVAGLLVLGTALAVLDRMKRGATPAAWLQRASRPLGIALLAGALLAGATGVLVGTDGRPLQSLERAWVAFSEIESVPGDGASRFTTLGSTRYDFWRVAVDSWREDPVGGLGQDNFAQAYLVGRRSEFEEPRWTHSLALRLLTHTGLVGAALFLLYLAASGWAANPFRRPRLGPPQRQAAAGLALLPAIVWLVHGSVDWLWEFPALSVPALALLGAAGVVGGRPAARDEIPGRRSRLATGVVIGASLLALAVILPSYLAARDVRWASVNWPVDPAQAFARLDRAHSFNVLAQRPPLTEGLIAVRVGDLDRAQLALTAAAEREPADWFARFELGLLATARSDRRTARRQFLAARARNPRDPLIAVALTRLGGPRPVGFAEADRVFAERVQRRLGQ